jgi:hypothetical protein
VLVLVQEAQDIALANNIRELQCIDLVVETQWPSLAGVRVRHALSCLSLKCQAVWAAALKDGQAVAGHAATGMTKPWLTTCWHCWHHTQTQAFGTIKLRNQASTQPPAQAGDRTCIRLCSSCGW